MSYRNVIMEMDSTFHMYLFLNDSSGCLARQTLYMAMTQTQGSRGKS